MDNREISKIRDQFQANQWPKFLESVKIDGLRGWSNQTVHFKFPIVAIVGENGSGKSTILKAAACAFQGKTANTTFFPSDFFKETAWENIQNVRLHYRIKQGNNIIVKAINWGNLDHRFGIGAGELFTILEDTMLDSNHHNWNSKIGNKVRMSSNNLWRIIADEWCKQCLLQSDKDRIVDAILSKLP